MFFPACQSYPPQTDLQLSGLYRWAGDANTFAGGESIELVCSPNNPDGAVREAVVAGGKAIHDLVYYWPQYTPITGRAARDIMLFTVSKITGHAGTRLGYVRIPGTPAEASGGAFLTTTATISQVGAGEGPRGGQEDGLLRRPEHHRRIQGVAAARHQDPRGRLRRLRDPAGR